MSAARTQEERRAATRAALIAAGRKLFARDGYEAVSSEALFAEVFEQVEAELVSRFDLSGLDGEQPLDVLIAAVDQFLGISLEADVQRIALLDGPAVLGWEEWYEVETRYGLGLIEGGLRAAADAGQIKPVPAAELAVMLLGALTEAALLLARAEDPDAARERSGAALRALIEGLRTG